MMVIRVFISAKSHTTVCIERDEIMHHGMSAVIIIKVCLRVVEACFLFVTAYIMSIILSFVQSDDITEIFGIMVLFLLSVFVYHAAAIFLKNKSEKIAEEREQAFRELMYLGILRNKSSHIEKIGMAAVKTRLEKHFPTVASFYKNTIPNTLSGLVIGTAYMAIFITLDPVLACVFAMVSLVQIIPSIIIKSIVQRDYEAVNNEGLKWFNFVMEAFRGLLTIKSFNLKDWYSNKLKNINEGQVKVFTGHFKRVTQEKVLNKSANSIIVYGIYAVIGLFVLYQGVNLESAIIFVVLSGNFFGATSQMYMSLPHYFEFNKAKPLIREIADFPPKKAFNKNINSNEAFYKIDNISFSYYQNDDFALKNFTNFVIKGEKIALAGPNGAGKSTFIKLLMNHYDNYKGVITLNGDNIKKFSDEDINSLVSYLPQNDVLLHMSVEEALSLFENSGEIKQTAGLLGFNCEGSQMIDTLSGGERKKLLLSICLTCKSECIILDEPTNSLDDKSEEKLLKLISECRKTMIISTHNSDLIACCDRVIPFGGTHELYKDNEN